MSDKQKFDLSNPGGQPKDWMQREHEKSLQPGLGLKGGLLVAALVVSVLGTLGALAWGALRLLQ